MDLYFAPLACSMATRIALYEAGATAQYIQRDRNKRLPDGSDFNTINPLGMVPTLRTTDGEVLTENAAILQYVAEQSPQAQLAPASGIERARLQKWLSFVGTELHKGIYMPLFSSGGARRGKDLRAQPRRRAFCDCRKAPDRPRIPARPLQRSRCVSLHGAQLDRRDAAETRQLPGDPGLHRTPAAAPEHREGARRRDRALQGREAEGGVAPPLVSSSAWRR